MQNLSKIKAAALTELEAARYLNVSRSFLAIARMTGTLSNRTPAPAHVKAGRKILYLIEDLDNFLQVNRKAG